MSIIEQISGSLRDYSDRLRQVNIPPMQCLTVQEAQNKEQVWKQPWASKPGVYLFFQNDHVRYVGRALTTALASRITEQANAFGDPKWDAVIKDSNTTVAVIVFEPEDAHIAASLEAYLIARFRSELVNLRSS